MSARVSLLSDMVKNIESGIWPGRHIRAIKIMREVIDPPSSR